MVAISSVLALDVGGKRVGLAVASLAARLPQPLTTLIYDDKFYDSLTQIISTEAVTTLVVGFPRGLQGQHTDQTVAIEAFAKQLAEKIALPIEFQDEALTSKHAKAELEARGKPYDKGDIDALAATYILGDWLAEHQEAVV